MVQFEQSNTLKRLPRQYFSYLAEKKNKIKAQYEDVIDLGIGNPDLPAPGFIIDELKAAASDPVNDQYGPARGFDYLKEAVAEYYQREYNVTLDPKTEVAILHGSKAGIVEISQCLLNPGDTVLLPNPSYPDYLSGIGLAGAKIKELPLLQENAFLPRYESIDKESAEAAKLLFLNYPNNPTAAVATANFFSETVHFAKQHGICVAHDFAYGTIGFDGERPLSFLQTPGAKETGIEFFTLSKSHNMAGWRMGFAVGNASVIEGINLLQDHTGCGYYGGIQRAAAKALTGDQSSVRELTAIYERRRDFFLDALSETGLELNKPKGSFYIWLKVPDGLTSEDFMEYLAHNARVLVAPGDGFGSLGEGYVRIGLSQSDETLKEAAKRIRELAPFTNINQNKEATKH
ncbi:aminotransferase class I/II-fold pyridoxal phosphate-dependent enzyme [Marinilactibacillus sp. XAAS-LB27]|uniref:aminotransferase class I/II-fold pyridoxal phosphate-dependent enzyme n=1 Tax=Marinilactibacillus sp. XAAS-LB27 TaxID=3114538 RepID=UPI002E174F98|nr:aminotransferase class I/II-fold pyridoxal phosphate-dependent enzyme [Marinilactibacillus sp. XAAS-LB27]